MFEESNDSVCVVGMGYVGSSLSAVLAEKGIQIRGVEVDQARVEQINDGHSPIEETRISELFERYAGDGTITATDSYDAVADCPVIIVTVGTPLAESNPDTSAVESAAASIAPQLQEGHIVIFRSTLPAGATEETLRPIIDEHSGLRAGDDYALAFCPERMAEGSAYEDLTSLPVVVGGYTDPCRERVEAFWQDFGNQTVAVSSPTAAELTKLADNWWIDLNIALANEVALLSEELGVDALEVIQAANTLPKGAHNVNILYPGSGVGGSCLVKDPWFVANLGEQYGLDLQTPRVSRRVNECMPEHMVELVDQELPVLDDATVAVLGYAFKTGTDDTRNTPAAEIVEKLHDAGSDVRITDPFVPASQIESEVDVSPSRLPEALDAVDAVMVVTGHEQYHSLSVDTLQDYVGTDDFVVVDGRFTFDSTAFDETSIKYCGVGRGT